MPPLRHVYLDWNATTPPHPSVLDAMRAAADVAWANPASVHGPGRRARAFVEEAREAIAALIGLDARDIVLTSGGTEANNLALALPFDLATTTDRDRDKAAERDRDKAERDRDKAADRSRDKAPQRGRDGAPTRGPGAMLVSRIEHPSIVRAAEDLERRGVRVVWIEPLPSGVVPASRFAEAASQLGPEDGLRLFVLQAVNHETGVVQPVGEVASLAHARGALLHVDAVQAVGRLPPVTWSGADLVSVAAHKLRGPKGIGALCTRPGLKVRPLLFGGAQERGLRPGTQDPIACAGFAEAARRARETPAVYERVAVLRDRLQSALVEMGAVVNGEGPRAPHVVNVSWPGRRGDELCAALDLEGVAVSSGSACSAGTAEPSPVITAMLGRERAASAVRVSLGEDTTEADVERALAAFGRVLSRF